MKLLYREKGYKEMGRKVACTMCLIGLLALSGCGGSSHLKMDTVEQDTMYLGKNGKIELVNVEKFDKDYYSKSELKAYIKQTIAEYEETKDSGEVSMDSFSVNNKIAKVLLTFDSVDTYKAFQGEEFQVIPAEEVEDNLVLPDTFVDAEKDTKVDKETVLKNKELKFLIVVEALSIQLEGTIKYYSEANLTGDNLIQTTGKKRAVIVYQ